jgi:hypothetical protein
MAAHFKTCQRIWIDISQKMAYKHMKGCLLSLSLGKCTSQTEWDAPSYTLGCLKLKKTDE